MRTRTRPARGRIGGVCPNCGLIFSKYMKARFAAQSVPEPGDVPSDSPPGLIAHVNEYVFHIPEEVNPLHVYARAALLAALVIYGIKLARMDIPSWEMAGSLIHLPMVPIHEFGHVMFRAFGDFMHSLGGSLFQVVLPLVFGNVFLLKNRDPFAASVMLWWTAVAVMDIAPYIYDALHPQHVLLTGRTGDDGPHDFIDVLSDLGVLKSAQTIGYGVHRLGVALMLVTIPAAQVSGRSLMGEVPMALMELGAVAAFRSYLLRERAMDSALFGILATAALLTKGTGILLAIVPPFGALQNCVGVLGWVATLTK